MHRKYRIISRNTLASLEIAVNDYIELGYEPCGGVFSFSDSRCVHQPLFRRHTSVEIELTKCADFDNCNKKPDGEIVKKGE